MKTIVIGDIILDTNHYCNTTRNAPEANIPVYNVIDTQHILGGAGNVAKNLQNLGCDVEIVSVIGKDYAGSLIKELLFNDTIKNTLLIDNIRKTTHKNRTFCGNVLVNRYDIEDTYDISDDYSQLILQHIKSLSNVDTIIFSDYDKGMLTKQVCEELISHCRYNNICTFVDPKPCGAIKYKNCFCLKLNLSEGETITGKKSKNDIFKDLKTFFQCQHIVLTCGENGLYVDSVKTHIHNTFPINVVDVTGCGDTVLAIVTYMYFKTKDIIRSCKIANHVARKCVEVIGNKAIKKTDLDDFIDTIITDTEADKLAKIANISKNIVFTNGCFDLIHSAHIKLLQFAKKLGDVLIVGINSDSSVKRLKGNTRPINDLTERCSLLENLGIIDYIVIFDDDAPLNILSLIKPNIIVKGGDYTKENIIGKEHTNEIVIYDYINGISSTNTINKIL